MRALGKQGFHVIRQAAQTAEEITHGTADVVLSAAEADAPAAPPAAPHKRSRMRKPKPAPAAAPQFDRDTLRARLEAASARPSPGTSELLSRPLHTETVVGHARRGDKLSMVESHDLTAMAPIHLLREGFKP